MPSNRAPGYLADILESIDHIRDFTAQMHLADYLTDDKTRAAVERKLLIISEAAKRLGGDAEQLCPEVEWAPIRAFGNIVRHEYDTIVHSRVWLLVEEQLSPLRKSVEDALAKLDVASGSA